MNHMWASWLRAGVLESGEWSETIEGTPQGSGISPLAASVRNVLHVKQAAMAGADVATVPPAVLRALANHPLTDKGLEQFLADWKKTGQQIV
jgi:transaldolase